jgi:GT2 family glycosyltransferase
MASKPRPEADPRGAGGTPGARGLSVVMPTWNGAPLLRESLPLIAAACEAAAVPYEIVVVDNGSEDETSEVLAALDAPSRCIRLDRNYGYAYTCNAGIREARAKRVLLINNDILAPPHFLPPLLEWDRENLFAVGSVMVSREEAFSQDAPAGAATSRRAQIGVPSHCCVLDRDRFLALGGFDLLFSPAMWEEMDLGARVWRSGGRIVTDPRSRVFHYTRATVRRVFTYVEYERIYHRHRLLFLWKHLPARLLLRHLLLRLPLDCASDVLTRGGWVMTPALLGAIGRLGGAIAGRATCRRCPRSLWDATCDTGEEADLLSWL